MKDQLFIRDQTEVVRILDQVATGVAFLLQTLPNGDSCVLEVQEIRVIQSSLYLVKQKLILDQLGQEMARIQQEPDADARVGEVMKMADLMKIVF